MKRINELKIILRGIRSKLGQNPNLCSIRHKLGFWKLFIIKYLFLNDIEKKIKKINNNKNLVFMIILPNMLHIADIVIKCVPKNMNLVLIMTGVKGWEYKFAKKKYDYLKIIFTRFKFSHSVIIDMLMSNLINPFVLLDHDCFVFNKDYFNGVYDCKKNEGILGFYSYNFNIANIILPRTFFLILNPSFLKNIMDEYKVCSSRIAWEKLPNNVKKEFKKLGINKSLLMGWKIIFFDTLRVLFLLCLIKGGLRFITKYDLYDYKDIFHIGGITYGEKKGECLKGKYISSKILETIADPYIFKKYKKYKDKKLGKSEDLLSGVMLTKDENFLKFSKELFKKLKIK